MLPAVAAGHVTGDTIPGKEGMARNIVMAKNRIDGLLDWRDGRSRADTAWMRRLSQRLRLKLTVNGSGSELDVKGRSADAEFRTELSAQNKYTIGISASYRGLSAGFAVNPAHLAGKNKDYEFNMNAYGNMLGADVIFQSTNTYKGDIVTEQGNVSVPAGMVRQNMLTLNAYYVFNARRFSYPAAFSQSWLQKRSCGSVMLGLSFMGGNLRTSHSEEIGNTQTRLSMMCAGIGVGYGYNMVLRGGWLLHLSTLPEIVVLSRCRMTAGEQREKMPYRFPNVMAVGRMAAVKHFRKYFAGFTVVVNLSEIGDYEQLQVGNVKWRARMFAGVKL